MKRLYIIVLVLLVFSTSCTKNFLDFNTDSKNPSEVEGEYFVTQAEKELVDQISSTNVNWNIWKLVAQYWTETTYTDEANYDILNRNIPEQIFRAYYRNVLKPLDEATKLITEDELVGEETESQKQNKLFIIDILEVYAYHNLVNVFGNVPYSEALDIENISPVYDDAAEIYTDLLLRLNTVIAGLDVNSNSYVHADHIYNGDVSAWLKFAYSLKLKIAINLADINVSAAQSNFEAAYAGAFTSAGDNALFGYEGSTPNTNPMHDDLILSGRSDFVAANTVIDMLNNNQDTRIFEFFQDPLAFPYQLDADGDPIDTLVESGTGRFLIYTDIDGEDSVVYKLTPFDLFPETDEHDAEVRYFVGGNYGYSSAYGSFAHINSDVAEATFSGILMTYSEIQFYIAEAAARGWNVGQTAEDAYNAAISASFAYWGAGDATNYLLNNAYSDYTTWQEAIGEQAWISYYTRGLVAYNTYRRLDYPAMNEAPSAATGNGDVPTRFTYPVNEQTLNAENYYDAASAIGGDDLLTRLFWDIADPE